MNRHCFNYGRFDFANVVTRWDRGDDDLGLHKTRALGLDQSLQLPGRNGAAKADTSAKRAIEDKSVPGLYSAQFGHDPSIDHDTWIKN